MSFTSFISSLWDDVFAPACAFDNSSSGFADLNASTSVNMSASDDDWTSAHGTQANFQPAAEAYNPFQGGGTFDPFDSSSSFSSSSSFD